MSPKAGKKRSTKRKPARRTSVLQVSSSQKGGPAGLPAGALLLFGGLCLLMLCWGVWLLFSWMGNLLFNENPRFTLQKVEVRTTGLLKEQMLKQWAAVAPGDNLYEVDLQEVRTRLEKQALIRSAVVQRKLPDTLSLAVTERVPIARMGQVDGGMNWLLDEEGIILKKSFESKHLPLLRGVNVRVHQGEDISEGRAGPVLPYLVALREMNPNIQELLPVREISVGHPDFMVFRLKDGFDIFFPREGNIKELLMEASRSMYEIRSRNLNMETLDMQPEGRNKIGSPE